MIADEMMSRISWSVVSRSGLVLHFFGFKFIFIFVSVAEMMSEGSWSNVSRGGLVLLLSLTLTLSLSLSLSLLLSLSWSLLQR